MNSIGSTVDQTAAGSKTVRELTDAMNAFVEAMGGTGLTPSHNRRVTSLSH